MDSYWEPNSEPFNSRSPFWAAMNPTHALTLPTLLSLNALAKLVLGESYCRRDFREFETYLLQNAKRIIVESVGSQQWIAGMIGEVSLRGRDVIEHWLIQHRDIDESAEYRLGLMKVRSISQTALGITFDKCSDYRPFHRRMKEVLRQSDMEFPLWTLTTLPMSLETATTIVQDLIPTSQTNYPRLNSSWEDKILALAYAGPGADFEGVRGTAYALYTALIEWLEYETRVRGRRESYVRRSWVEYPECKKVLAEILRDPYQKVDEEECNVCFDVPYFVARLRRNRGKGRVIRIGTEVQTLHEEAN